MTFPASKSRTRTAVLLAGLSLAVAGLAFAAPRGDDSNRKSKNGKATGTAGGAAVTVEYGRPKVGGRELWGFPKKLASPSLRAEIDTLVGTLDYGPVRVATATMGYKHRSADLPAVKAALAAPNFLLKIIPHVDGSPRICELVEYYLEDVRIKGAWTGPAALSLTAHALAPVAVS